MRTLTISNLFFSLICHITRVGQLGQSQNMATPMKNWSGHCQPHTTFFCKWVPHHLSPRLHPMLPKKTSHFYSSHLSHKGHQLLPLLWLWECKDLLPSCRSKFYFLILSLLLLLAALTSPVHGPLPIFPRSPCLLLMSIRWASSGTTNL